MRRQTYAVKACDNIRGEEHVYYRVHGLVMARCAARRLFHNPRIASIYSRNSGVWVEDKHGFNVLDLSEEQRSAHARALRMRDMIGVWG